MESDGFLTSVRQFVTDYRRVRLTEGFVSTDPEFAQQLPFRDATGRNTATWRVRARHYLIMRAVLSLMPGVRRVLDLGAGNGWLSRRLSGRYRVTSLDLDAGETGLAALKDPRVGRICGDLEALPVRDGAFDVVIAAASMHYSTHHERVLAETARVLRRGGLFILADSPVYADAASRDRAWQRTLSHYQRAGYPELARRYQGLTAAELADNPWFRFATVSPGVGSWKAALEHLAGRFWGRARGARLPVLLGWKRSLGRD
jgi:SAM-dependent methyltransferase